MYLVGRLLQAELPGWTVSGFIKACRLIDTALLMKVRLKHAQCQGDG
jgi:hypothetical protein